MFTERLKAKKSTESKGDCEIPIFDDAADMQAYFLKEVQLSDDLMQTGKTNSNRAVCWQVLIFKMFLGNFEEAVLHLANAAVVCSQKSEFLGVMQKTLPPQVFQLLIQYYQIANEVRLSYMTYPRFRF